MNGLVPEEIMCAEPGEDEDDDCYQQRGAESEDPKPRSGYVSFSDAP